MTDVETLNHDAFDRRASLQSAEVPEDAVTADEYEWQTLRTILSDAGITPQVGDWVFKGVVFSFAEGADDDEDDPPDETMTTLLREWGLGPDKAWAIHGALKEADLSLVVTREEE
jgi:hypothetical protein